MGRLGAWRRSGEKGPCRLSWPCTRGLCDGLSRVVGRLGRRRCPWSVLALELLSAELLLFVALESPQCAGLKGAVLVPESAADEQKHLELS